MSGDNEMRADFAAFWRQRYATQGCYLFTTYFSQRLASILAWAGTKLGISANAVTLIGLFFSLLGSFAYAGGLGLSAPMLAFVLLQSAYIFDCADGQLARASKLSGPYGAWLDVAADHVGNIAIAMALYWHLMTTFPAPQLVPFIVLCFAAGETISLHTVSTVKTKAVKEHGVGGAAAVVKYVLLSIKDTPAVIAAMCFLWFYPTLLAVYLVGLGLLDMLSASIQAHLRLRE